MLIPVFDHFQTHAKKKQSDQTLRRSLGFAEMTETGGGSSSPSSPSGGHFKLYEPLEQQEFPDKYVIRSVEAPDQGFVISCRDGAIEPLIAGAEADSSPKKPSKTSTIYGVVGMIRLLAGGGRIGKKAVQQNYASVLTELILQLGSCHGLAKSGQHEPLRVLLTAFQVLCECVGDLEMGKILARDGEQNENERWINLIGDIVGCISIKRPKEVQRICVIFSKSLIRHQRYQREAAGAALSEFIRYRVDAG